MFTVMVRKNLVHLAQVQHSTDSKQRWHGIVMFALLSSPLSNSQCSQPEVLIKRDVVMSINILEK